MTTLPWHRNLVAQTPPTPAILVVGHAGAGAGHLALSLAASFAGATEDSPAIAKLEMIKKADGKKEWYADKNADILSLSPEQKIIPVDAVRRIIEFCAFSPMTRSRRVAVLLSAECLNAAAANALLKTLEEPAADKSLILSAHAASLLPPTIVSRCQIIIAPPPTAKQAAEWLKQNGGSAETLAFCGGLPLLAAKADTAKIAAAVELFAAGKKLNIHATAKVLGDFDEWLDCLQKWVADGCRAAAGLPARYFPASEKRQRALCNCSHRWLNGYARLLEKRFLAAHPLARDLFIKETLHDYRSIFLD